MHEARAMLRSRLAKARLTFHTLHDLGLATVGQIAAHSVRRRRALRDERAARAAPGPAVAPGPLQSVDAHETGARLTFAQATLEVGFLAEDVVVLTWGPGPAPVPYAIADPLPWPAPAVTVAAAGGASGPGPGSGCEVSTGALAVAVAPDGAVTLRSGDGAVLRQQAPPVRRGPAWDQRYRARPGERFFGLGEQAAGIELRGRSFRMWNRDPGGAWGPGQLPMYTNIPVLLAVHRQGGLLSFYENSTYGTVALPAEDEEEGEVAVSFAGGVLREYVTTGEPAQLLDRYSALTGRPALPPRWALGYHQSRWGYKREAHVLEVLDGYRAEQVPLSAVHLDIDYMRGYRVFTIDDAKFPDMAGLAGRAGSQGVRLVTIVDPAVKVDDHFALYRQGVAEGRFCRRPDGSVEVGVVWPGRAAFPDFTDPGTRRWWAEQYRLLADAGVSGAWHDMNEPTSISLSGDPTLPASTRHDLDGRGGDHGEAHNLYGLLMNRAGFEGLRAQRPEARPWIVSRSGWAGTQRYAWNWTGDVESTWAGLRQQVATVVGLGLSGVPYSGSDIGGFSGIPDDELYLRWLQMAVFMPFCRTHSVVGAPPREPWRFADPARRAIGSWIRFRYRLLPYLYSLAHEASAAGTPLARPLWWPGSPGADEDRHRLAAVDDAFLLGDALLVAPVTEPGAERRDVPVPAGSWRSWWAAERASAAPEATASRSVPSPLERIPVLVRGGSILPLDDGWAQPGGPCALDADEVHDARSDDGRHATGAVVASDHAPRLLAFHCWPDGQGTATGMAIDDAGDGDGPTRRDELELSSAPSDGEAVLRWRCTGDYPAPERVRVVLHGVTAESAEADGRPVDVRGGSVVCGSFEELRLTGVRDEVSGLPAAPAR